MKNPTKSRSTLLVAVGAGVFLVGTGLAFVATRDTGPKETNVSAAVTTTTTAPGFVAPRAESQAAGFTIPPGHQAMAVQVPFAQGVAGYAKAGDKVNVYGAFKNAPANATLPNPAAKLVLANVEVLAVDSAAPGSGATGAAATYLLAVDAIQAEALVYLQSFESAYLTLAREDQGILTTPGRTPKNAA
ncbi:MAG TPA: RcpC/CpaB family pilus assembly protein [Acidimicrobiales bacterium]|nr:RcpC/CpaB family pilus assembly protein [Acidimicrobiales bacterium]